MDNIFYFVRHGETEIKEDVPVSRWPLSMKGRLQAERLANEKELLKADMIFSSDEQKAYDTAMPLARVLGKPVLQFREFDELRRDKGGSLPTDTFKFAVKYAMRNPDKSKFDWETASHAILRFNDKLHELDLAYNRRRIVIVSHGCILNMYFANLLGKMHEAFERLEKTGFCSWGIVKDGKVVKDIVG